MTILSVQFQNKIYAYKNLQVIIVSFLNFRFLKKMLTGDDGVLFLQLEIKICVAAILHLALWQL